MPRPRRTTVCSVAGCPTLTTQGRCEEHRRNAEQQRGTAAQRGYSGKAWRVARRAVLRRDPICKVCGVAFATVADHHPISRRNLVAMGIKDPDAPSRMRGLCAPCHSRETARDQPGGWHQDR